jgi:hypothetical protein
MGKFEDFEMYLLSEGDFDRYDAAIDSSVSSGRQHSFDQLRYAMAAGHSLMDAGLEDGMMFVGGLGVLGNLVNHYGLSVIDKWRGTSDIDLVLRNRSYNSLIENIVDSLDFSGKSNSIPNKKSIKGYSSSYEGVPLESTVIDVYIPSRFNNSINIEEIGINSETWDKKKKVDFYGIPLNFLDPLTLLNMKLVAAGSSSSPRDQDVQDIFSLLSVMEGEGISGRKLKNSLSHYICRKNKLIDLVRNNYESSKDLLGERMHSLSREFRRNIIR